MAGLAAEEASMSRVRWIVLSFAAVVALPCPAHAWDPWRSESSDVTRGNELMKKGDSAGALEAYETAARRLPHDPGVQLNRGLALLAQGKRGPAREAFQNATQGSAPADVRGEALYDIGLSFMQDADAAEKSNDLDGAQKALREAVDGFKSSLRAKPGAPNTAWNLELARRRLAEVEKKQQQKKKEEEEKKKEEEQKNDQDAGTPPEDQPDAGTDDQKDDQGEQKKDDQGQQGQDGDKKKDDEGKQGEKKDEKKQDGAGKDEQPKQPQPKPDESKQQPQKGQPAEGTPEQRMPEHMRKALDALESGEENLEKHRAQMRARQRPRRIEKDW
jgi:Ca-activated chloride channel family protein